MHLCEIARFVDDVDAMASFYHTLLGKPPIHQGDGIALFEQNGVTLLLHRTYTPGPNDVPCEDHIAFAVTDVDQAVQTMEARGLKIEIPPRDFDWGRSAYLRDPSGRLVELTQQAV